MVQLWIVVAVLLVVFLSCTRWYKKHDKTDNAPGGFVGAVEMLVMMINDDVIKSSIGEKRYRKYAPYLLTVFFFIFITNLLGLLPIFPGGSNVTGNINITFFLAVCTFLAVNLFGNRESQHLGLIGKMPWTDFQQRRQFLFGHRSRRVVRFVKGQISALLFCFYDEAFDAIQLQLSCFYKCLQLLELLV